MCSVSVKASPPTHLPPHCASHTVALSLWPVAPSCLAEAGGGFDPSSSRSNTSGHLGPESFGSDRFLGSSPGPPGIRWIRDPVDPQAELVSCGNYSRVNKFGLFFSSALQFPKPKFFPNSIKKNIKTIQTWDASKIWEQNCISFCDISGLKISLLTLADLQ